ncbi:hypothetical protein IKF84_01330 [Candidatus Saccharibacteria bacterium]|nr:hypothetical protein [Candidatus Saccharibacteria bacterium]
MKNFFKKFLVFLGIIATVSATVSFAGLTPVSAEEGEKRIDGSSGCPHFLGMTSWDCNVPPIDSEDTLVKSIATIATNILTDISVIASYLVLFYVIYGGFLYITSAGDPGKAANGKKTLVHAFIGLAIVTSAYTIFSAIRIAIATDVALADCVWNECASPNNLVANLINWLSGIVGVVSAAFVLIGAWGYITANGDPSKLQKAKQTILYAIIGLVIFALAQIITGFVSSTLRDANSYVNNSVIANNYKEININA